MSKKIYGVTVGTPTNPNVIIEKTELETKVEQNTKDIGELSGQKMDKPSTATVGQMVVVKAVGEDGKPTEFEAVNIPEGGSGGNGADGFSPIATVTQTSTGATISIQDKNGTTTATITNGKNGADGKNGNDGQNGQDGKTPVKGTDYFTEADKTEMVQAVYKLLGDGNGVSY